MNEQMKSLGHEICQQKVNTTQEVCGIEIQERRAGEEYHLKREN